MKNDALDQLAQSHDGCTIAAFADIDVGIVLRTASGTHVGQEALNTLCIKGKKVFAALAAASDLAVHVTDKAILIFVRASDDPSSALLASCDRTVPLQDFIAEARACMGDSA